MREILFRGKCIGDDDVYGWVDGYYVCLIDSYKKRESHRIYTGYAESDCGDFYGDWYEVDPKTIGQFTGLLDKNGNRIFEGDIIDASNEWWSAAGYAGHSSPIILVEWNEDECGFSPFSTYDSDCGVFISAKRCEVIGNIYDNPEIKWCN